MNTPREAALDWIRRALSQELPNEEPAAILDLSFQFDAIAQSFDVPTEELVAWLHDGRGAAAEYTMLAWRAHAKEYAELQRRLCGGAS